MQQQLLENIVEEVRTGLRSRFFGRVFQLAPLSFAIDFGLRKEYLYFSVDPLSPRFYLVQRSSKQLEKDAIPLSHFGQLLRLRLGGALLSEVSKDPDDRVIRLTFNVEDEIGTQSIRQLVVQLTGKAANALLLNEAGRITDVLRPPRGSGQTPGEEYQPPPPTKNEPSETLLIIKDSPSAAADEYFREFDNKRVFTDRAAQLRSQLNSETKRLQKLKHNLQRDLLTQGDPESHKRLGDLLLANAATAKRAGTRVEIVDYYTEGAPTLELEIDESMSLQDEAAQLFRLYTKAKRGKEEITQRLTQVDNDLKKLEERTELLAQIVTNRDEVALSSFDQSKPKKSAQGKPSKEEKKIPGVRRYLSSDGYEIWVGRAARDNDNLTFRLAKPSDLWLHAGDYPGSHVVVRNPARKEIPQKTIIEAAQLAGYFSQARDDSKVVVHYTERKFLAKPKGAAPGLVRMSRFRSITVEPKPPNVR